MIPVQISSSEKLSNSSSPLDKESKESMKPERAEKMGLGGDSGSFKAGGASIVYVHTFCAQLMGEGSSLELCRNQMRLNCDIDVLSWFKLSPSESSLTMSMLTTLKEKGFSKTLGRFS